MDALYDYHHLPAVSSPASDLSVPMEKLDLADWHEQLHDEIEWMREILLPEINREYLNVCEVWFENPVSALEEDKKFLELTLEFLSLTRDDEVKWSKDECFYFVRRIKSYVLHLRDLSYGNLPAQHLDQPGCQNQVPEQLQQQCNKEAVLIEPPNLRKWPRLAKQLDLMYEEFQSLKDKYLPILSQAFGMYCKFCVQRGEKYYPLMINFAFCTTFLRRPKEHLLLFSMEAFNFYVRRIKLLVTASSNSQVLERESADWHNELHKEIESMRRTELPDIRRFYKRVRELCHKGVELTAELKEDKRFLEFALRFLSMSRAAKISWSKEACFEVVKSIKLYGLRYRREYRKHQHQNSEQQEQFKMEASSNSRVLERESADWHNELHEEIESMRKTELPDIRSFYKRVHELCHKGVELTAELKEDKRFLEFALRFLSMSRAAKISWSKEACFEVVKSIKLYGLRYRIEYQQHQHQNSEQQEQFKMEGSQDSTSLIKGDGWLEEVHNKIESMREKYLSEIEEAYRRVCLMQPESADSALIRGNIYFLMSALNFLRLSRDYKIKKPKDTCFALLKRIEVYVLRYRKSDIARLTMQHLPEQHKQLKKEFQADDVDPFFLTTEPASIGPQLVRQSSWSAAKATSEIPRGIEL